MHPIRRPGTRYVCDYDEATGPILARLKRAAARGDFRQVKKQGRALQWQAHKQSRTRQTQE